MMRKRRRVKPTWAIARGVATVIEFEDLAAVTRFYESEAHGAARAVREVCAETVLWLVEGV